MKIFFRKSLIYFLIFALFLPTWLVTGALSAQKAKAADSTIAIWNFPNNPDNAVADGGIEENLSKTISTVGTDPATFDVSGATTEAARAEGWDGGSGTKYWQISFVTTGYHDLTLSSKQKSSNTGPKNFKVQYSLDGSLWTDIIGGEIVALNNYTSGVISELPLPVICDNQSDVILRWIMTSNTAVNGGSVGGAGSNAIDDIIIGGQANLDTTAPTATMDYSTLAPTNQDVVATLVPSEPVTVTNNGGLFTHTFTANGTFTFEFEDLAGNTGSATATVNNIDKVAPVITLIGDALITVDEGAIYTDSGATALDDQDGDITSEIVVSGDTIDTDTPGVYIIKYDVSDTVGNPAVEVTRTVAVSIILSDSNKEVILGSAGPTSGAWIIIPEGLTGADLDLNSLIILGSNPPAALTVRPITMVLSTATGDISITIPAGTMITGSATWDGKINLPAIVTDSGSLLGSVGNTISDISAFTIGSDQGPLTFSAPVKIVFAGRANKSVGFIDQIGEFNEITALCDDINSPTDLSFSATGECKINSADEKDLVVYTKHFTEFVTYQKTAIVLNSPVFSVVTSIENNEKYLTISWKGVGGAVEKYEIAVNDVKNYVAASLNDLNQSYSFKLKVSDYGDYRVLVRALAQNTYSSNATFLTVKLTAPGASAAPVPAVEETVVVPSISPATAKAAEPQPAEVQVPSDNSGIIKGEENTSEESGKTNWTPWIILFILIVLAGAATGGYFYWFAGREETEGSSKPIQGSNAPKVVVRDKKTIERKKPKRW